MQQFSQERPDVAVDIRWLPYFLNPDTPLEGEPYRPFLERKFGGTDICGVPCFIFNDRLSLAGAQPPDILADAIRRVIPQV